MHSQRIVDRQIVSVNIVAVTINKLDVVEFHVGLYYRNIVGVAPDRMSRIGVPRGGHIKLQLVRIRVFLCWKRNRIRSDTAVSAIRFSAAERDAGLIHIFAVRSS